MSHPAPQAIPLPPPPTEGAKVSRLAIAGLVFGLISVPALILLLPQLLAVICGHLAHYRINHHDDEPLRGKIIATIGLVFGYTNLLLWPLVVAGGIFLFPLAKEKWHEQQEINLLRKASQLFIACENYSKDHDDRYPESWEDLKRGYVNAVDLEELLRSPYGKQAPYPAFKLKPHQRPLLRAETGSTVVIQELAPPRIDNITVVYADGNIDRIPNPARP